MIKDKRIDGYIKKAQPFAQPILLYLRELIHTANPAVEETIKWGMPAFEYKGPLCSFASFKQHVVFTFWKGKLLKDPKGFLKERSSEGGEAMGHLGRITAIDDLPPKKVMIEFIKQASRLNDDGVKIEKPVKLKPEIPIPGYFSSALSKNKAAKNSFESFSPSCKREYLEWITEAKTEATREKRLHQAIEWMAEGKTRNWKYQKK